MSVAAVDNNGNDASFSRANDQVEIAAPGVGIQSTVTQNNGNAFGLASWSGTSMGKFSAQMMHVGAVDYVMWYYSKEDANK